MDVICIIVLRHFSKLLGSRGIEKALCIIYLKMDVSVGFLNISKEVLSFLIYRFEYREFGWINFIVNLNLGWRLFIISRMSTSSRYMSRKLTNTSSTYLYQKITFLHVFRNLLSIWDMNIFTWRDFFSNIPNELSQSTKYKAQFHLMGQTSVNLMTVLYKIRYINLWCNHPVQSHAWK